MKLRFHKRFIKGYNFLDQKIKVAFQERLKLFFDNPYHPKLKNHPLKGKWYGYRSINISGDIRAVYKLNGDEEVIFIAIGSHSYLYG